MRNYDVYFEIYGKKLKTKILAETEHNAKEIVRNKIVFHKVVEKQSDGFFEVVDKIAELITVLGGKKK